MSIELITGAGGSNHIGSEDVGAYQAYTYGTGVYILNGCEVSVVDANTARISEGEIIAEGRHIRIKGSEDVAIRSGMSGTKRNDLIVVSYTKTSVETEEQIEDETTVSTTKIIESAVLSPLTGTPTEGEAVDPSYVQGSVLDGDLAVDYPLCRIPITDLTPGEPEMLMEKAPGSLVDVASKLEDHDHDASNITSGTLPVARGGTGTNSSDPVIASGTSGNWRYVKFNSGLAICSFKKNYTISTPTQWGNIYAGAQIRPDDYPFAFTAIPSTVGMIYSDGFDQFWVSGIDNGSTTVPPCLHPSSDTSKSDKSVYVCLFAVGRWK